MPTVRARAALVCAAIATLAPAARAAPTDVGDAVIQALKSTARHHRGVTWNTSADNALETIVQTPDSWGSPHAKLSVSHSCKPVLAHDVIDPGSINGRRTEIVPDPTCDEELLMRLCKSDADCTEGGQCKSFPAAWGDPGKAASKMCIGHSDAVLLGGLWALIAQAREHVDVTSLQPPDGRYLATVHRALLYLGNVSVKDQKPRTVRLLFGAQLRPGALVSDEMGNASALMKTLVAGMPKDARLKIYVGIYRTSSVAEGVSWNHSKIVAVDGDRALVGGHNLIDNDYIRDFPVRDLSLLVRGTAAFDAHRFADTQWNWVCRHPASMLQKKWQWNLALSAWADGAQVDNDWRRCPPAFTARRPRVDAGNGVRVIAVGQGGGLDPERALDQSELAQVALINAADKELLISQQDLLPVQVDLKARKVRVAGIRGPIFDALAGALARGVDVSIVVSSPGATAGPAKNGYSWGWQVDAVRAAIESSLERAGSYDELRADAPARGTLTVVPLRWTVDPDPDLPAPGNHAKMILVDRKAFYVGSHNLYDKGNTEFGFIVDDDKEAARFFDEYWTPLWKTSSGASGKLVCATPDRDPLPPDPSYQEESEEDDDPPVDAQHDKKCSVQ